MVSGGWERRTSCTACCMTTMKIGSPVAPWAITSPETGWNTPLARSQASAITGEMAEAASTVSISSATCSNAPRSTASVMGSRSVLGMLR